jgi:TPR repeat protein
MNRRLPCFVLLLIVLAWSKAAAQSQPAARSLFDKGINAMVGGASQNNLEALDLMRRSAEMGYAPAQVVMGYMVENGSITFNGKTTGINTPAEPGQAVDWYKKAAMQGDRLAYWLLGRMYYAGSGVQQDLSQAEVWFQKAVALNDPFAEYLLGQIKLQRQDYAKAADLFRRAAVQGLPQAQAQLGLLLKDGKGLTGNNSEAYSWLLVAYENGVRAMAPELSALEAVLGTNETETAKSRARELQQASLRAITAKGCTGWEGENAPLPAPPPPDIQSFCR